MNRPTKTIRESSLSFLSFSTTCCSDDDVTVVSRQDQRYAEMIIDKKASFCSSFLWRGDKKLFPSSPNEESTTRQHQRQRRRQHGRIRKHGRSCQYKSTSNNGFLWLCAVLFLVSSKNTQSNNHSGGVLFVQGANSAIRKAGNGEDHRNDRSPMVTAATKMVEETMKAPASPPSTIPSSPSLTNSNKEHQQQLDNNNNINGTAEQQKSKQEEQEFFIWCQQVMGIETLLTIETFEYPDFQRVYTEQLPDDDASYFVEYGENDNDDNDNDDVLFQSSQPSECDYETVQVRGLAASRDIQKGEVVISIPFHAMISISTTIDHDPVLSRLIGPEARSKLGWDQTNNNDADADVSSDYYELPLLSFAILYHYRLGRSSPLYHYIELLKSSTPRHNNGHHHDGGGSDDEEATTIPFLWNRTKLKRDATEGVQRIAMGIKRDVREMYDTIIQVLIDQHPDVFGKNAATTTVIHEKGTKGEWIYSFHMFQWAFAMVNSRHWHLPIQDLDPTLTSTTASHGGGSSSSSQKNKNRRNKNNNKSVPSSNPKRIHHVMSPTSSSQLPPAEQPTEEFVSEQNEELLAEEEEVGNDNTKEYETKDEQNDKSTSNGDTTSTTNGQQSRQQAEKAVVSHSFMAPLADLLNFGPPCTRGVYNTENRTFDIIATCSYQKGQEVTFWYSDDCADVIIANYGFTHPMVPKCLSTEDWKVRSDLWRHHAEQLEEELIASYDEIDRLDLELHRVQSMLDKCSNDCAGNGGGSQHNNGHDSGVRGGHHHGNGDGETPDYRRRIRRDSSSQQRHTKKSDLGL